jgi:voltage-gated potassium channel
MDADDRPGEPIAPAGNIGREADHPFRQWVYALLEEGQLEGLAGRTVEFLLVALIVANVVAVALESIPSLNSQFRSLFLAFEEFSLTIYTVEYFARVWSSVEDPRIGAKGPVRGRLRFALRPMMVVDFLAFAPSYLGLFLGIDLRVLRIFRLFRLLKLARYSQALQALLSVLLAERSALFASVILLLSMMCLEGELMHLAEGRIQPQALGTLPNAMYWALTTLTTVGYGDITPQTAIGKAIAGMTMVTGLSLFALPVGIIANGFVAGLSRRRFGVTWNMLRRQPLLKGFDGEALTIFMEAATASVIREHSQIAFAGSEATDFYLIVSGVAHAEESGGGYGELMQGDMIGEEALHRSAHYGRTVTAQTDMRVIALPGSELRRLARKYPVLAERLGAKLDGEKTAPNLEARLMNLESENARLRRALSDLALKHFAGG